VVAVLTVTSIVGGLAALLVVGNAARGWWRRNFGRRANSYDRLRRLGTGANLTFFEAVLGDPPAVSRSIVKSDYLEYLSADDPEYDPRRSDEIQTRTFAKAFGLAIFIDRDYYVQAISETDGTVLAFSVTTRSRRFRPVYVPHRELGPIERWRHRRRWRQRYRPLVKIELGKTRFADLDPKDPDQFAGPRLRLRLGAHNFAYSEITYFGNPGYYQDFAWTTSDASGRAAKLGKTTGLYEEIQGQSGEPKDDWPYEGSPEWADMPRMQQFRRETTITTYTVIGVGLSVENYPINRFGPWIEEVRTIP